MCLGLRAHIEPMTWNMWWAACSHYASVLNTKLNWAIMCHKGLRWHRTLSIVKCHGPSFMFGLKANLLVQSAHSSFFKLKHQTEGFICLFNHHKKWLLSQSRSRTGCPFHCHPVFWSLRLHAAAAECRLAPQRRCAVLFWTWNVLWMETKAEVVETALALLLLTLFILYVTFSGRGEWCCERLCNRSSSNAQAAHWSNLSPPPLSAVEIPSFSKTYKSSF